MPEERDDDKYRNIIETTKKHREEKKEISVDEEFVKVVIFTLNGVSYAFYGSYVKSILPYSAVTFVPGCPDYILGIINVRGDIESVLNIHHFLGLQNDLVTSSARIVIAETSDIRSGILVNSVEDVIDVAVSSIAPSLSTIENSIKEFVVGELDYKNSLVTVFNVEKIFDRINIE